MSNKKATLRSKTFDLLRNRPACIRLKDVAKDSDLPLTWVKNFHLKGDRIEASVVKVEKLYEYLTGKSLL